MKHEFGRDERKSEHISCSELNEDRINLADRVVDDFDPSL
jgi:hypothetical protein